MSPEHRVLREGLQRLAGTGSVATPDLRRLARAWLAQNKDSSPGALLKTLDSLFASEIHDEKTLGALILGYSLSARRTSTPARADAWLGQLAGWAQVDALCANVFQAEDLLEDWPAWGAWLRRLASDANINKRRASLVLLTGPVRRSADPRLLDAALANLDGLKAERPILITKAVSWLLRNLVVQHRDVVAPYLEDNREALPAVAVRELYTKLATGRKTAQSAFRNRPVDPHRR